MDNFIKDELLALYAALDYENMRRLYDEGKLFTKDATFGAALGSIQTLIGNLSVMDKETGETVVSYYKALKS